MAFCTMAEKIIKCQLEFLHPSSPTVEQIKSNFTGCFADVDSASTENFNNKINSGQINGEDHYSSFWILITLSALPLYQAVRTQHTGSQF